MTRGCRSGFVTKTELVRRLDEHLPEGISKGLRESGVPVLLGHASYYGIVSEHEEEETVPRTETTLPCYLHTHVTDERLRNIIDEYVVAASKLYRRGGTIANLIAMELCGPRHPGAGDVSVAVWRPRWGEEEPSFLTEGVKEFANLLFEVDDVRASPFKHIFLPERWPTEHVPRSPTVQRTLDAQTAVLPPLPDWRAVTGPTGWDNAINRMATKYFGNIQVHSRARLQEGIVRYLKVVPIREGTVVDQLIGMIKYPLRPLTDVHQDDWDMAFGLRSNLVSVDDPFGYPMDNPLFTRNLFVMHLFLTKYGVTERSYLPVVSRGRKYCYLDSKILTSLKSSIASRQKRTDREEAATHPAKKKARVEKKTRDDGASTSSSRATDHPAPDKGSTSVGELLGITSAAFNRRRNDLRSLLARRYRRERKREPPGKKRERARKLEERWSKIGFGKMSRDCRIDSVETDGVGLRMCLKTPIDMRPFKVPVPLREAAAVEKVPRTKKRRVGGKEVLLEGDGTSACVASKKVPYDEVGGQGSILPVHIGIDTGVAKPFVAAVWRDHAKKPHTVTFTRRRYYFEMHYSRRLKWETRRLEQRPAVKACLATLSASGGVHNCDTATWVAYLTADREADVLLDAEYVQDVERALWKMRMFRWKKRSLDRAVGRLLTKATGGLAKEVPLNFVVGSGGFAPGGPGQLSSPTSALTIAFGRGIAKERAKGRVVFVSSVDEYRTTCCCCSCGALTRPPPVQTRKTRGQPSRQNQSRRLRSCTECDPIGKLRDRDVQAARNMLWIAYTSYYGLERPEYLRRPVHR